MLHLAFAPARAATDALLQTVKSPLNPFSHTAFGRSVAASAELFERMTRRYGKPMFGLNATMVDGAPVEIVEEHVWLRPFCGLLHFKRQFEGEARASRSC
jgi:poly(3-hydroxybutyrate) depolymerase